MPRKYVHTKLNSSSFDDETNVVLSDSISTYFTNEQLNGYKRLEYIESSGTQYIDTDYIFTNNKHTTILKFNKITLTGSSDYPYWACGSYVNGTTRSGGIGLQSSGYLGVGIGNIGMSSTNIRIDNPTTPIELTIQSNGDGTFSMLGGSVDYINQSVGGNVTTGKSELLFGPNANGTKSSQVKMKLYYCKLYDNDILVRDFIPMERLSDNKIGLYDFVTNTFYSNNGTGEFIAGPYICKPSYYVSIRQLQKYIELEYIESSGSQYIDTGVLIDDMNYVIKSDLMYCSTGTQVIYGEMNTTNGYPGIIINGAGDFRYGTSDRHILSSPLVRDTKYSTELSFKKLKLDGVDIIATETTNTSPLNYSIYLFARNNMGTAGNHSSARIYNWSLSHNGELIKDLIPVKRNIDGVLGMYDRLNDVFYTNRGSGNFIAGPEK